jgi:hypothetical protein
MNWFVLIVAVIQQVDERCQEQLYVTKFDL